jgi:TonB family protein
MFVLISSNYCFMKFRFLPLVSGSAVFLGFLVFLGSTGSMQAEVVVTGAPVRGLAGQDTIAPKVDSLQDAEGKSALLISAVEEIPIYPGCKAAVATSREEGYTCFNRMVLELVSRNVVYPKKAIRKGIQGSVLVSFIIEKDGYVSNVKVESSVDPELDAEAVRVIKMMPRMEPAKISGKPVRIRYAIPINFRLK